MAAQKKQKSTNQNSSDGKTSFFKYLDIIDLAVSRIGWTGITIAFIIFALISWTTIQQKQEFIDIYVLLKWNDHFKPFLMYSIGVILLFVGQSKYYDVAYNKKCIKMKEELERLSTEKSKLQEKLLGRELQHSSVEG